MPHPFARLRAATTNVAVVWGAVALLTSIGCWSRNDDSPPNQDAASGGTSVADQTGVASGSDDPELLSLIRRAIDATENLRHDEAVDAWRSVLQRRPDDESSKRNLTVALVNQLDARTKAVSATSTPPDEAKRIRGTIPELLAAARAAIADLATDVDPSGGDGVSVPPAVVRWMQNRVTLREAELLGSMGRSVRGDVLSELVRLADDPISDDRSAVVLGGQLLDTIELLTDPIDGLSDRYADAATAAALRYSEKHPDNIYLSLAAARLGIEHRDADAGSAVRRSFETSAAIRPAVATKTAAIGRTPTQMIDGINEAVAAENFAAAGGPMAMWFNVLNGTEFVRTDRRRANPHPLDFLSTDTLRKVSAAVAATDPIRRPDGPIRFQTHPSGESNVNDHRPINIDAGNDAIVIDADLDGVADVAVLTDSNIQLHRSTGNGFERLASVELKEPFEHIVSGDLFVVDSSYRNRKRVANSAAHDTLVHLIAAGESGVAVFEIVARAQDDKTAFELRRVEKANGLEAIENVKTLTMGDFDADGDLDLAVVTDSLEMYLNRGNRTFFPAPMPADLFADLDVSALAIGDFDRDLDLDLIAAASDDHLHIAENLLHAQFRYQSVPLTRMLNRPHAVAIEDFDGDASWDLFVADDAGAVVAFGDNPDAGVWSVAEIASQTFAPERIVGSVLGDFDNDSYLEWIVNAGSAAKDSSGALAFEINGGGFRNERVERVDGPIVAGDFNGDGRIDLLDDPTQNANDQDTADGLRVAINQTESAEHYLDVRFKGIDDNASGRVNHYAIGGVLETRFGPHYRARIITSAMTHFGLDGYDNADLRAVLPNGLTQVRASIAADQSIAEQQSLKGSCPYLYASDGESMRFVTDCLWAAPLGLQTAPGVVVDDRPWEYLKIDGSNIRPVQPIKNSDSSASNNSDSSASNDADSSASNDADPSAGNRAFYDFRITEELWEIAYFDHVAIVAVDHPADVQIWTNEKVGPPQLAEPKIFAFKADQSVTPTSATDTDGNDCTALISAIDDDFVKGFDRRLRQGVCPPHHVDLEFKLPPRKSDDRCHLILTGWILPTDTSLNIQLHQNPEIPAVIYPRLYVDDSAADADAESRWRLVEPGIGFPGGKTKTMVVDVTPHVRSQVVKFRVETSAEIYWDAASLVTGSSDASHRVKPMIMLDAELRNHGFSRSYRQGNAPERYVYDDATTDAKWPPLRGPRTQYGDCTAMLSDVDDAMVVMGPGDEVRMRFAVPSQPPPDGWVRDFVMHNVGWDKDADLNTLTGQSTLPLPSQSMSAYPPEGHVRPNDDQLRRLRLNRTEPFRQFWKR